MGFKIAVTYQMPREWFKAYEGCEVVFPDHQGYTTRDEQKALLSDADAAVILMMTLDDDILDYCKKLRAVTPFGAGYDMIDVDACTKRGIAVCHAPRAVCEPTAEFSMGMIMDTLRTITWRDRQMRNNPDYSWDLAKYPSRLVMGKTLGIVGMGRIGKAVARRAYALGMKIVYNQRRQLPPDEEQKYEAKYLALDELLSTADVVSLHMPLTDETRGMIGAREIALMKKDAHLVNMARGAVVDEPALIEALKKGAIAGAALDVFCNEPHINPEFKTLDNVILTPHVATDSAEARAIIAEHTALNLLAVLRGERPADPVNEIAKNI